MTIANDYNTLLTDVGTAASQASTLAANVATLLATESAAEAYTNEQRVVLAAAREHAERVLLLQAALNDHTHDQLVNASV